MRVRMSFGGIVLQTEEGARNALWLDDSPEKRHNSAIPAGRLQPGRF
jgi:hypothetical protein